MLGVMDYEIRNSKTSLISNSEIYSRSYYANILVCFEMLSNQPPIFTVIVHSEEGACVQISSDELLAHVDSRSKAYDFLER